MEARIRKTSGRSLRTTGSEVLVLVTAAFVYSMAFPGFMIPEGLGFIALFALIPVFAVIRHTSWKHVWWYGLLFGLTFYLFFAYWLKGFHALAIILIPIIKAFEFKDNVNIYNIGTGTGYSVLEIINNFEKATGIKIPYKIVERRSGDIGENYSNSDKTKKELNFSTKYGILDMCHDAWNFEKGKN